MSDRYHYVFTGWSDWEKYKFPNGQEFCDMVRRKKFACKKGDYIGYEKECLKAIGPPPKEEQYNSDKCNWLFYSVDYNKCTCKDRQVPIKYFCPSAFGDSKCGKNTENRLYSPCPKDRPANCPKYETSRYEVRYEIPNTMPKKYYCEKDIYTKNVCKQADGKIVDNSVCQQALGFYLPIQTKDLSKADCKWILDPKTKQYYCNTYLPNKVPSNCGTKPR